MSIPGRVTDYDSIADRFDTRYHHYSCTTACAKRFSISGPEPSAALEVGCGTGHWLGVSAARGFLAGRGTIVPDARSGHVLRRPRCVSSGLSRRASAGDDVVSTASSASTRFITSQRSQHGSSPRPAASFRRRVDC